MWYRRKIAICLDTGETVPVVSTLSDFNDDITPTIFFDYFRDVPVVTVISECLDTMNMAEILNELLPQEEPQEEIIPDTRHLKDVERGGDNGNRESRKSRKEKGWETKKVKT